MPGSTGAGEDGSNSGTHTEAESHPWARLIPDHPPRTDTPAYLAARALMNKLVRTIKGFFHDATATTDTAGRKRYEDHHGGGLWLKDDLGWFLVRGLAGWNGALISAPIRPRWTPLRQTAQRLYALFPEASAELGIQALLDHPITTAADVAKWTDSVCNASVLSMDEHRGVLPAAGGIHLFPARWRRSPSSSTTTSRRGSPTTVAPPPRSPR
jgi:Family of unknown function (DUF6424)